jgi:hypothetical protein
MTEKGLRELLDAIAERAPAASPELAGRAWASARRRRRRQWAAVIGAAALAMIVTLAVDRVGDRPSRPAAAPDASATASPRPTISGVVQVAPDGPAEARLPQADTRLRGGLDLDPARALLLSAAPVRRSAAVVQAGPSAPVLVLGDDGRTRVIDDVRLVPNADAGGNGAPVLDSTSLSPDGARVALLQPAEVVVVDLASGAARHHRVPGSLVRAVWPDAGAHVLISRDGAGSVLLDVRSGTVAAAGYQGADVAFGAGRAAVELLSGTIDNGRLARPATLRRHASTGAVVQRELTPMVAAWEGAPFVRDGLVARAAVTTTVEAPGLAVANPQAVAVIDTETGQLRRLLAINDGAGHSTGCCPVLGWLDSETVLVANLGVRVLAWNTATGELTRVAELPAAAVSLGDISR